MIDRDEMRGAVGAFILFAAVTAAGVFTVYAAVEDFARARASRGWPETQGVILSRAADDDHVRYAWFDGEQSHTGERVRYWTRAFHPSGAAYEPGKPVKVRYSPEDGSVAVLEPGGSAAVFAIALSFGALLVFIGLAGIVRLTMMLDGLTSDNGEGVSASGVVSDTLVERRSAEFDLVERRGVRDRRGEYPRSGVLEGRSLETGNGVQ
jgi:hypothetical protein